MSQTATLVASNGLDHLSRKPEPQSLVLRPRRHRNRTVTIIDWDDTILPSHEIFASGMEGALTDDGKISLEFGAVLKEVERRALSLLQRVLTNGLVVVVTASEAGWVERSGSVYLPGVIRFFRKHSIRIISARSRYERECGPYEWKIRAFHDEIRGMFCEKNGVHVVVVGDGLAEYLAALRLKETYKEITVKAVKFVDGPNLEYLIKQLTCLETHVENMFEMEDAFFCMGCIVNPPRACDDQLKASTPCYHTDQLSSYVTLLKSCK